VARHARRIIRIHDGVIVDGASATAPKNSEPHLEAVRQPGSPPLVPVLRSRATAEDGGGDEGEGERAT
jgi:hypothetical protein